MKASVKLASVKLAVFILAYLFSTVLSTPTCRAKPRPEDVALEQWRERWMSTETVVPSAATPDVGPPVEATIAGETPPGTEEAKSAAEGAPDGEETLGTVGTTAAVNDVVEGKIPVEEIPDSEISKFSELPAQETNISSIANTTDASTRPLPLEDALSDYSSEQSDSSGSDGEYVSCEAAGGTLSNIKTLRFCYFKDDSVEICACPLNIFNDFDLELDDIYDIKYSHFFEDGACYFKKKSL